MYTSFTIEQIIEIHEKMGVAVECDGDRKWFNTYPETDHV